LNRCENKKCKDVFIIINVFATIPATISRFLENTVPEYFRNTARAQMGFWLMRTLSNIHNKPTFWTAVRGIASEIANAPSGHHSGILREYLPGSREACCRPGVFPESSPGWAVA